MLDRIYLVSRQRVPGWLSVLTLAMGLVSGIMISTLILMLGGVAFEDIVNEFVVFVFLDEGGLAQALTTFIPLALVGLAAAAAIKLNFWNIGVEGQMWFGAMAATGVAIYDIGPDSVRLPLMFLAAAAAGTAWISVPALLKLRYGINEIITTLLLTYVAALIVQNLLFGIWRDPGSGFPASPRYDPHFEQLSKLGWGNLYSGIWIALGTGLLWFWIMHISRFGFFMSAIGKNPKAARSAGLPVARTVFGAAVLSGGLAGVAGLTIVAGQEYRLTIHIADGYTFSSIVIAFVARFHPLGILVAALMIAGLHTSGDTLKVFYQLPSGMVTVLESIILLSILIADFFARYHIGVRRLSSAG